MTVTMAAAVQKPKRSPLALALRRLHPKLRPWHLFVACAVMAVAVIVLSTVLVHLRDQQSKAASVQLQVNVRSPEVASPAESRSQSLPLSSSPLFNGGVHPQRDSIAVAERGVRSCTPSNPSIGFANLGYAQYRGTVLANGISQFLGMRFAAPPTGNLRWRAPVGPETVQGDQMATAYGKICLGISVSLPSSSQGEDCLFANLWAPANATVNSKLPVWLFIQGGGYTTNSNANWNGSQVVQTSGQNIVLVNFNYRVGLWGFLASERVRADGDLNVGLLDQRMMMKWVQEHIAQFGGDPDHVVIHGASAGAGSVALHLIANGGTDEGLFHGAIGESIFFPAQPKNSELEWQFDLVLNETDCVNISDSMGCLRGQVDTVLQAANIPSPFPSRTPSPLPLFYWTPCIDGELLQDLPYNMFKNGDFVDVPVIIGTDTNEGSYFGVNASTLAEVAVFLQNNYPHLTDTDASSIMEQYPLMDPVPFHNAWFPSASMAYGEATFICPNVNVLDSILARNGNSATQTWGYRYNVVDKINAALGLGVPHIWESWAVFGPDSLNGVNGGPASYYTYNAAIVPIVMKYWLSFVQTLDPNELRDLMAPEWEGWGDARRRLIFQVGNTTMESTPDDQLGRCAIWEGLASALEDR